MGLTADVIVLGAGPAGLALTAELCALGVDARVLAPDPEAPWAPNYGAWEAELPAFAQACAEVRYPEAHVVLDAERRHTLPRPYVRIDGPALQARLLARIPAAARLRGAVETRADAPPARLLIDATGAMSPRVRRRSPANPGWQAAWGEVVTLAGTPPSGLLLMDWSGPAEPGPPSFLYALPLSEGRWFIEETVLVSRPPANLDLLRERMERRLAARGLRITSRAHPERCLIPMGMPLPTGEDAAFGAAAGLIHPATGYSLALALRLAQPSAAAVAAALPEGGAAATAALNQTLWPAERARAWAFYRFGMEALAGMSQPGVQRFFHTFFQHDPAVWSAWMSGELPPVGIVRAMLAHFGRLDAAGRLGLMQASLSYDGLALLAALLRG